MRLRRKSEAPPAPFPDTEMGRALHEQYKKWVNLSLRLRSTAIYLQPGDIVVITTSLEHAPVQLHVAREESVLWLRTSTFLSKVWNDGEPTFGDCSRLSLSSVVSSMVPWMIRKVHVVRADSGGTITEIPRLRLVRLSARDLQRVA